MYDPIVGKSGTSNNRISVNACSYTPGNPVYNDAAAAVSLGVPVLDRDGVMVVKL